MFSPNFCCQSPWRNRSFRRLPCEKLGVDSDFSPGWNWHSKAVAGWRERSSKASHLFGTLAIAHSPMPSCLLAGMFVLPGLEESRMTQAQYTGVRWMQMENIQGSGMFLDTVGRFVRILWQTEMANWPISRSRCSSSFFNSATKLGPMWSNWASALADLRRWHPCKLALSMHEHWPMNRRSLK